VQSNVSGQRVPLPQVFVMTVSSDRTHPDDDNGMLPAASEYGTENGTGQTF
jgi:hypothetical protein